MVLEFKFPDVGEGIHEGTLIKWLVKEGEQVKADQNIAEVETDKAVVEIPSPRNGTILKTFHKEGETIEVGHVLAVIGDAGEKVPEHLLKEHKKEERYTGSVVGFVPAEEVDLDSQRMSKKAAVAVAQSTEVLATPMVRKLAKELGVDITKMSGSGPQGRITEHDVRSGHGKPAAKKIEFHGPVERIPLSRIRKITAEHMTQAWLNIPMVTNHDDVDMTQLWSVRAAEKEKAAKQGVHITFVPYIVKAIVNALKKHPVVMTVIDGDELVTKKYYNVGVAIDAQDGLIVPVIRDADKKSLYDIAKDIMQYSEKAKTRKIDVHDLHGGVITITNLGAIGGTYFTPIVNYPESSILGTGKIEDKAIVKNGEVVVRKTMAISFSYDHRVIDGAAAARFINDVKQMLENPEMLK